MNARDHVRAARIRSIVLVGASVLLFALSLFAFLTGEEVLGLIFLPCAILSAFGPVIEANRSPVSGGPDPSVGTAAPVRLSIRPAEHTKTPRWAFQAFRLSPLAWVGSAASFFIAGILNRDDGGYIFLTLACFVVSGFFIILSLILAASLFASRRRP